jgi:hypothetical protein
MTTENPTADGGASIEERIERFLEPEVPQEDATTQGQPENADPATAPEVPETEVEPPAKDAQTEADEPQIALSDVAQYLGVDETLLDVSDEGDILVKTKIDGQDGTAKFEDLVKSYQLQGHVDNKARQAAETERVLQERVQQFEEHAQSQTVELEQVYQFMEHTLLGEFQEVNWQNLAQTDPAGWAAAKQAQESRVGELQKFGQYIGQRKQQEAQAQEERDRQKFEVVGQVFAEQIPGWQPRNEVDVALNKFAQQDLRLTPQQVAQIVKDFPGAGLVMWESMQYRAGKQTASVTEKKIRTAPKLVRPGQSVTAKERTGENVRGLKEQVRKSGGKGQSVTDYLIATGKV